MNPLVAAQFQCPLVGQREHSFDLLRCPLLTRGPTQGTVRGANGHPWRTRTFNLSFAKRGNRGCFSGRTGQSTRLIYCPPASRPLQLASCSLAADVGCHAPPRGVRMPRSFNSAAIARTLVMPWDRRSIHDGPLGSPHAALRSP
jgi:hypothetical protein